MNVNDGSGLYDKYGMINRIKHTLDYVADMRGWARCTAISEAVKQLDALAEGLKKEDAANEEARAQYRTAMENAGYTVTDVPAEDMGKGE